MVALTTRLCVCMVLTLGTRWARSASAALPHFPAPVYRFEEVKAGAVVEHEFVIANPTEVAVRVARVRTSCGCTVAKVDPDVIPAKGQASLRVVFKTVGRTGAQRKHIFVSTDHPQATLLRCSLEGKILPGENAPPLPAPVMPLPNIAKSLHDFGTVPSGTVVEHDFRIRNEGTAWLEIQNVRTTCGCTAGEVTPRRIAPGGSGVLHVVFKTGNRVGPQRKSVHITTNSPKKRLLVCWIEGKLTPRAAQSAVAASSVAPVPPVKPAVVAKLVPAAAAGTPRLRVPSPSLDFGQVLRGTPVTRRYVIWNDGDGELHLPKATAACSCTRVARLPERIPPGGSDTVELVFSTLGRSGPQHLQVVLQSNDPANRKTTLQLTGTVTSDIDADPAALYFPKAELGKAQTATFRVVSASGAKVQVEGLKATHSFISAELVPTAAGSSAVTVRVTVAPDLPPGPFAAYVALRTNDPLDPRRRVRVAGRVLGPIALTPSKVYIRAAKERSATVVLTRRFGPSLVIEDVASEKGNAHVEARPVRIGEEYQIIISPARQLVAGKILQDIIVVRTNSELSPIVRIPVLMKG